MPAKTRQEKEAEQVARDAARAAQAKLIELDPAPIKLSARGRTPVTGRIVWIDCPLYPEQTDEEGYVHPQLKVGFRVDNQQQYLKAISADGPENFIEKWCKAIALIAHRFSGWDFLHPERGMEIPVPDPADPLTYICFLDPRVGLLELGVWIAGEGVSFAGAIAAGIDPRKIAMPKEWLESQHAMRNAWDGTQEPPAVPVGGQGYQAALEGSLSPNSESA